MHGGHQNLNRDRFGCRSGVGGVWRCHDEGAIASAARMQTVFWKRMDIDVVRSCSERVCSGFDVRLMVIQNVSTGRDEAVVMYMHTHDPSDVGMAFVPEKNTLYSMEVDVRSYERLRRDEKLLVDFSEFLSNLVWLLEQSCRDDSSHCHADGRADAKQTEKRFRVVLHEQQGKLEFLECNAFRELSHLKLCIQSNSEKGTVKYLSFRLQEVLEENIHLQRNVESLEHNGRQMYQELSGLQERMSADTYHHSNEASTWKMQCDMLHTQISTAKEQHEILKGKLEAATAAEECATKALSEKDLHLSRANDEILRLQATIESMEDSKTSLEDLKSCSDKEIERLKGLCDGYKSARDMADARIEDWKRMAASHEAQATKRAQAIHHMEKKILRLSQDLSEAKTARDDEEKRIHQRDELMKAQEEALRSAQSRVSDLQQQQRNLEQQVADRDKKLEDALQKLHGSTKKAENSEKMIVWLNKQLTSIQLKSGSNSIPSVTTPSPPIPSIPRESPKTLTPTGGVPLVKSRLSLSSGGSESSSASLVTLNK